MKYFIKWLNIVNTPLPIRTKNKPKRKQKTDWLIYFLRGIDFTDGLKCVRTEKLKTDKIFTSLHIIYILSLKEYIYY